MHVQVVQKDTIHCFIIFIFAVVFQLAKQSEGTLTQRNEINETFRYKKLLLKPPQSTKNSIKNCAHLQKRKTASQTNHIISRIISDKNFVEKPVVQYDVPVVKLFSVDDGNIQMVANKFLCEYFRHVFGIVLVS